MITINDAFQKFLNEQEAFLKPETFRDYQDVISLYGEFLDVYAEDYLLDEDRALYDSRREQDQSYCDIFGPDYIGPYEIEDFLGDYLVEIGEGKKFVGTAATFLYKFFEWAHEKGYVDQGVFEENSEALRKYKKR